METAEAGDTVRGGTQRAGGSEGVDLSRWKDTVKEGTLWVMELGE